MAKVIGTSGNDTLAGVNGEPNTIYGDTDTTADPTTQVGNDTLTGGANSTNNTIYPAFPGWQRLFVASDADSSI